MSSFVIFYLPTFFSFQLVEFKERMHEIFPQAKKNPPSGDESENIETVEDFIKYITKDKTNKPAPNPSDSDPEKT